jgi:hypothetical protein
MTAMLKTEKVVKGRQVRRLANPREIVDYNFDFAARSLGLMTRSKGFSRSPSGRSKSPSAWTMAPSKSSRAAACSTKELAGPFKGGIRYRPDLNQHGVRALAEAITMGGSCFEVHCNHSVSQRISKSRPAIQKLRGAPLHRWQSPQDGLSSSPRKSHKSAPSRPSQRRYA